MRRRGQIHQNSGQVSVKNMCISVMLAAKVAAGCVYYSLQMLQYLLYSSLDMDIPTGKGMYAPDPEVGQAQNEVGE